MQGRLIRTGLAAAGAVMWASVAAAQDQAPAPSASVAPASDGLTDSAVAPAPSATPDPPAEPAAAKPTLSEAIAGGKLILEFRPRYEFVDQTGIAKHANAYTLRTRLGWETGDFRGFKALIEMEDVRAVGGQKYNSTVNGRTTYPVVGDPPVTELNRAQIAWTPSANFSAVVGRQRVNLDDQRFIGAAAWRQDEQTFDAARLDASVGRLKATYLYLDRINRVFGEKLDWDSDSHAFNATYALAEPLKLEGFLYALNFKQSPVNSTVTYGVRATGATWVSLVKLAYAGSYARQRDYRGNPGTFALDYWSGEVAGTFDIYTLKANYEVLGSDGVRGFGTPLATLHAFQGWADVFLTTPAKGIKDANLSLTVRPRMKWTYLYNLEFFARYNDFHTDVGNAGLGHEWDLQATAAINPKLTALVKLADYRGPAIGPASRTKVWVGFEYKL